MKKKHIFNKFISLLAAMALVLGTAGVVYAEDDVDADAALDGAAAAGYDELNAITDYSSYGAYDVFEQADKSYLGGGFADVDDSGLASVLGALSVMDFINGYEDGTYRPDNNISRAEFTTAALRLLGCNAEAFSAGANEFYDVGDDHFFKKEIAAACSLNLVTGFNDGTFRPEGEISVTDAVVIMTRALGYSVEAESTGGYPLGYISVATGAGLYKNMKNKTGVLTRGDAAHLFYNSLNAPILEQIGYGDDSQFEKGSTMLSFYHKIYTDKGIMQATSVSPIGDYKTLNKGSVQIDGVVFSEKSGDYNGLLGYEVKYFYKNDPGLARPELIFAEKTISNEEISISAKDIASYLDYTYKYYEGDKLKTAKLATDVDVFYNNVRVTDYTKDIFKPKTGFVKLHRTDSGDYTSVFISEYFNVYLNAVSLNESKLVFSPKSESMVMTVDMQEINFELYDKSGKIDTSVNAVESYNNDGEKIMKYTLPPIPSNSLLSIFTDKTTEKSGRITIADDAQYLRIYINGESVTGRVDGVETEEGKAVINNVAYRVSQSNFFSKETELKIGLSGKFLLDIMGELAACDLTGDTEYRYGYLINAVPVGTIGSNVEFKIVSDDGKIAVYSSADSGVVINDSLERSPAKIVSELGKSAKLLDESFTISQLIKYKTNTEGKVSGIETVTASIGVADGVSDTHLKRETARGSYMSRSEFNYNLNKATDRLMDDGSRKSLTTSLYSKPDINFIAPETETFIDDDYGTFNVWQPSQSSKTIDIFDCDDSLSPAAIVVYAKKTAQTFTVKFVGVDYVAHELDDEGMAVDALVGADGFADVRYQTEAPGILNGVKNGDILRPYGTDDIIKSYDRLTTIDEILATDFAAEPVTTYDGSYYFSKYEVYSYDDANRMLTLQTGAPQPGFKRANQRVSYWFTSAASLHNGVITCTVKDGKCKFKAGSTYDIRDARTYGHEKSSKILLGESSGYSMKFMLIVNVED